METLRSDLRLLQGAMGRVERRLQDGPSLDPMEQLAYRWMREEEARLEAVVYGGDEW